MIFKLKTSSSPKKPQRNFFPSSYIYLRIFSFASCLLPIKSELYYLPRCSWSQIPTTYPHSLGLFIIKGMVAGIQAIAFLLGLTKIISFPPKVPIRTGLRIRKKFHTVANFHCFCFAHVLSTSTQQKDTAQVQKNHSS